MAEFLYRAGGAAHYQVRIAGHLDAAWADWFGVCTITVQADATSLLVIDISDQAMLYGLIARMRDLGLTLLSLQRCDDRVSDRPAEPTCDSMPPASF